MFQITRCSEAFKRDPFSTTYNISSEAGTSPSQEKVRPFLEEQQRLLDIVNRTPNFKTFSELGYTSRKPTDVYTDVKAVMQNTHTILLSEEQLDTILKICQFLKTFRAVSENLSTAPQRFKIVKLCSITLHQNNLLIHLKKAAQKCIIGEGNSITTRALLVEPEKISLVAELTTKIPNPNFHEKPAPLRDRLQDNPNLLVAPMIDFLYRGSIVKGFKKKQCRIFPLYSTDLFNLIFYHHRRNPILTLETHWRLFYSMMNNLETLHNNNLVYRDLKPENCLVRFRYTDEKVDFNHFDFAFCDLGSIKDDSMQTNPDDWQGSDIYFPKHKTLFKEIQKKHSDIYALGVSLKKIFYSKKAIDDFPETDSLFIDLIVSRMCNDNPQNRPTISELIAEVTSFLKEQHPDYLWINPLFLR